MARPFYPYPGFLQRKNNHMRIPAYGSISGMELRKKLAQRLRQLMEEHPSLDTQTKVANAAGVAQSTIQRILTLEQAATVDLLEKLAHAFGIQPIELLAGENSINFDLMRAIGRMPEAEKNRVIGYVELASGIDMRQNGSTQLEFESRSPVPHQLRAAKERASARRPGADMGAQKKSSHETVQNLHDRGKRRKT